MAIASQTSSASWTVIVSAGFIIIVFGGIIIAVVLSLISTYGPTRDITPAGEKYCISNLRLNITLNTTAPYGNFNLSSINTSYPLSEACYRILQSYKSDNRLWACLISNCSLAGSVVAANVINTADVYCYAEIYYGTRCVDKGVNSGLNLSLNASNSSACRTQRMKNINQALGSTSIVDFTNVPSLIINNVVVPMQSVRSYPFSFYSQVGAYYCAVVSRTNITSAVYTQATG